MLHGSIYPQGSSRIKHLINLYSESKSISRVYFHQIKSLKVEMLLLSHYIGTFGQILVLLLKR